ncbi:hypothetical protein [Nannocystis sp. SCPEA4]|uniref:hypothetical protein n=1 Tax=Nannocystis sp. SCPEA4 TaxID=2996787 RepID=UPI00226E29B9|nr:hypothetical protein [Nannocystis sp. SCPEA4]MCY1060001.1 hypothetical protein [Nannocystis sp. SCPEA4]
MPTATKTRGKAKAAQERAMAAKTAVVKTPARVVAGTAKKSTKLPATSAEAGGRVASSLEVLLSQLAMDAYIKAEKSGDRESHEREGRGADELFDELWEAEYRWIFFSAFFELSPEVRSEAAVRMVAQNAFDIFRRGLSDERACFAYCKRHWRTMDRLALLSFHDGASERPLVIDSFAAVRKKVASEKL